MILTYGTLYRLVNSRLGHLCRSMQQNEDLASSIGVNIAYIRIVIFMISSFFGGIGGAMFGSIAQSVYPSTFQVVDSVNFMLNCFLGGLGYVFGPMLGTLVLYFGWDLLFEFGKISNANIFFNTHSCHPISSQRFYLVFVLAKEGSK